MSDNEQKVTEKETTEKTENTDENGGKAKKSKKNKFRKDKPWDDDSIDHWKPVPVSKEDPCDAPLEESSFATLFPKYREAYIREVWPSVTTSLKHYGVKCELDLIEGSMTVKTTRKTWDPAIILKARDLIKLLARSLPVQQAIKVLRDDMYCDIIKIKNMVRNKERFVKRRQRLIGPNGCTLKAIELVTGCYVLVQGNTVCGMGDIKGLKHLRQLVEACMKNTHPIYSIKKLMIQRELAKNPELKEESWERFLPKFQKRKPPKKKKKPIVKKEKTPFPPEQKPRKVDIELETGEYFLNQEQKKQKKREERSKTNAVKRLQKQKEKAQEFIPPKEEKVKTKKSTEEEAVPRVQQPKSGREAKKQKEKEREETKKKKRKREEKTTADSQPQQVSNKKTGTRTDASSDMLQALKEKFKKQKKAEASKSQPSASEYVLT